MYTYYKIGGGIRIPVEKLGWFRKKIAGLGKRIYFRKSKKINLFSVNCMTRHLLKTYAEINNGNYELGLRDFCAQIEEESKNIIAEMIETPILFGISMKSVMSKSPEDLAFISALTLWAVLGKEYQELWSEPKLVIEENGVLKLTMREQICLFCTEERELTQNDLGDANLGDILASIFKGIIQALEEYVGNEYEITARETKCLLRGDTYGEITLWLKPIE